MLSFELLCVTMNQNDFSKISEMNIRTDVVFANQADETSYKEYDFEYGKAKMITTQTRGVGINRNFALSYASADICLFADDDVTYADDVKEKVVSEFEKYPDADIIIFNIDASDEARKQKKYTKSRKCRIIERMPWGACRIAFRLKAVRKANVWFTTLFGGGCVFPSGEDSMWLNDAKKRGLKFYISKETLGVVDVSDSSWFTGYNEKFYYGKGAFYKSVHPKSLYVWMIYFAIRTSKGSQLSFCNRLKWMNYGKNGYENMCMFEKFKSETT